MDQKEFYRKQRLFKTFLRWHLMKMKAEHRATMRSAYRQMLWLGFLLASIAAMEIFARWLEGSWTK